MIPDYVLEALVSVLNSGAALLKDQNATIAVIDVADEEAADWLRSNRHLYPEACLEAKNVAAGGENE